FGDRRDRIHVPLHEVAVEPGAEDHRPLEVDPVPDTQVAEGAAAQALRDDVEGDAVPLRTGVGDRQAHPVDGDRGTVGGAARRDPAGDRDPAGVTRGFDRDDLPQLLDDPGEHQLILLTAAVMATSSPRRVTSVVVRRRASVIVAMPASSRTGRPAPSRAGATWATTSSTRSAATKAPSS